MTQHRTLCHLICLAALFALDAGLASASTPMNWIEREGLRFAGRIDVGTVPLGEDVQAQLVLENTGAHPVWIERLSPTCGCTVVDWVAAFLLPGQTQRPAVRLDPYDIPGHHRHSVRIVGTEERTIGMVVVTADAIDLVDVESDLVVGVDHVEIGPYRAGDRVRAFIPLRNTREHPVRAEWYWKQGETVLASAGAPITLAPNASALMPVELVATSDLWTSRVVLSSAESTVEIPVRGHWQSGVSSNAVRRGAFAIDGVADHEGDLVVDFGALDLGEVAHRTVRFTNQGTTPSSMLRAFTSSDRDLAIGHDTGTLAPGESAEVTVEHLGVRGPGSFRAFVHVIFDGAPAVRLVCRGYVQSAMPEAGAVGLRTLVVEFDRSDPTAISIHDETGARATQVRTLDHASYARAMGESNEGGESTGRVCTNCMQSERSELDSRLDVLDVTVYAVIGDERFGSEHAGLLPHLEDPNAAVIRALHPEHARTRHTDTLPVVVFHDDFPLVEEAARRTRIAAVFVVAASTSDTARVVILRDVIVLDPGRPNASTDPVRLRLHLKDQQILEWELLVPERS